jgi:hypothetical protein
MEQTQNSGSNSTLGQPVQRGLSRMLASAFAGKINTYEDFIKHFGIVDVIKALSAKVRGKVLVTCNGGGDPERASKMNADIVASTIASMLEDKLVTPDDICTEISTDHMVEVLSHQGLYRFLFGKLFSDKTFMKEVLEIILEERLLGDNTASSFMHAVGDDKVIDEGTTPPDLLAKCQLAMIARNREGGVFTDEDLLRFYTPKALVQYVVPHHLFAAVEAVAELNGWREKPKLPPEVLDSVVPPPGTAEVVEASLAPPPLPTSSNEEGGAAEEVEDLDAVDGEGVEITLDADGDDGGGRESERPAGRNRRKRDRDADGARK